MIDQLDRRLAQWVQSVHKKVDVAFELPKAGTSGRGVVLHPVDLATNPAARGPKRPPLRIRVRYLVTAWAEKPEEAHRLVGELVFAALDHSEYEVEADPVPADLWTALGAPPRVGFLLKAPLRLERVEKPARRVTKPPVFRNSPLLPLLGAVVGPRKIPIMGARVELTSAGLSTLTDANGRFAFPAVPTDAPAGTLRVSAKGRTAEVEVPEKRADPVVIRLEIMEP